MPERLFALQLVAIGTLVGLYAATKFLHVLGGHDYLFGLAYLLDLDRETNVPAAYSMMVILANAGLLALIAALYLSRRRPGAWFLFFLALVFLFLAYDEAFSVHERIARVLRDLMGSQRPLHLTWTGVGFAFAAIVALASSRFLLRLPKRTRGFMVLSGAIFVAGAVGFEVLGGFRQEKVLSVPSNPDPVYFALMTVEESLEMLGMALFNYTLLDHIRSEFGRFTFQLS